MYSKDVLRHLCKSIANSHKANYQNLKVMQNAIDSMKEQIKFEEKIIDTILKRTLPLLPEESNDERTNTF